MTWLSTTYIWLLVVTAPQGETVLAEYSTDSECVRAMATMQPAPDHSLDCRQRVLTVWQSGDTKRD